MQVSVGEAWVEVLLGAPIHDLEVWLPLPPEHQMPQGLTACQRMQGNLDDLPLYGRLQQAELAFTGLIGF